MWKSHLHSLRSSAGSRRCAPPPLRSGPPGDAGRSLRLSTPLRPECALPTRLTGRNRPLISRTPQQKARESVLVVGVHIRPIALRVFRGHHPRRVMGVVLQTFETQHHGPEPPKRLLQWHWGKIRKPPDRLGMAVWEGESGWGGRVGGGSRGSSGDAGGCRGPSPGWTPACWR